MEANIQGRVFVVVDVALLVVVVVVSVVAVVVFVVVFGLLVFLLVFYVCGFPEMLMVKANPCVGLQRS